MVLGTDSTVDPFHWNGFVDLAQHRRAISAGAEREKLFYA